MEVALANHINPRANLIVPNVHWGLFIHECDILVITKAGYAWEVEIKVTKADLLNDKKKKHGHKDHRIKNLYFAIPHYLKEHIDHIPERAGIIIVNERKRCKVVRKPKSNKNPYKFSEKERYQVARLGAMRMWTLKRNIIRLSAAAK